MNVLFAYSVFFPRRHSAGAHHFQVCFVDFVFVSTLFFFSPSSPFLFLSPVCLVIGCWFFAPVYSGRLFYLLVCFFFASGLSFSSASFSISLGGNVGLCISEGNLLEEVAAVHFNQCPHVGKEIHEKVANECDDSCPYRRFLTP